MDSILQWVPNFLLVFCRISSFFLVAPVFSARNIPMQFKAGFSFFIAFLVFGLLGMKPVAIDAAYLLMIVQEILTGILLGFVAYMFFSVVQIAGSFIDLQMGFGIANVIDPMTGAQSPVLGNFKFMVAVLLFFAMNGHHWMLQAIMDSYQWIPIGDKLFESLGNGSVSDFLVRSLGEVFVLAFQLSAPLVASLFLVDAGLGILARTSPQFNIFFLGMPLKILIGFILLLLLIPGFVTLFSNLFDTMFLKMRSLLEIMAGTSST